MSILTDKTQREYEDFLRNQGFQLLGHGAHASVYAIPHSEFAIKVGHSQDKWPIYAEWAIKNGYSGNFAPKIYGLKFHSAFYVAIMERLVCTIRQLGDDTSGKYYYQLERQISSGVMFYPKDMPTQHSDLHKFCEHLRKDGFCYDLGDTNTMLRKDGQIVVTDPIKLVNVSQFRVRNSQIVQK